MGSVEELSMFETIRRQDVDHQESNNSENQVHCQLDFERRGGNNKPDAFGHYRTNASNVYFTYPLKLMLPTHASSSNCQWVYPINYGGGIVSGDNVEMGINVRDDCCAMLTTQASTKVYHSEEEKTSRLQLNGKVGSGSTLAVLQDPVTCFAGARYKQFQTFHLEKNANLVYMDWLTAGRIARGERWDFTSYTSCNSVFYHDAIVLRDAVSLETTPLVDVKNTMGHFNVIASCVLVGERFSELSKDVVKKYGRTHDYGTALHPDLMVSVSAINKTIEGENMIGAFIKIASTAVSKVYEEVENILRPLFPMLGGNPFEDKH